MSTPEPEVRVTWGQALAWRLQRHLLDPVGSESVAGVVRRLGVVPSMDESLAELAVRSRRRSSRPGELAAALAAGTVVKVFAFRGAVHYLSPEDGGAYLALRCAGRQWELPSWVDYYRLRPEDWPGFRATVREALDDGPLTLAELGAAVTGHAAYRHLEPVFAEGAGTLIKPLAWQGDMGFGPPRDGRATFQRLDANPRWKGLPELDEAGPTAILAYLRTYGPTTPEHVQKWLGSGLSAGRKRLDGWWRELGDAIAPVGIEGTTAYAVRADLGALQQATPSQAVRFLPGHDQWVIGPGTQDIHVTPSAHRQAMTRKANPVIHGGVVKGTWQRKGDELTVSWLAGGKRPAAAIEAEAERLSPVLGNLRLRVTS